MAEKFVWEKKESARFFWEKKADKDTFILYAYGEKPAKQESVWIMERLPLYNAPRVFVINSPGWQGRAEKICEFLNSIEKEIK